jgi:hypothetical protein
MSCLLVLQIEELLLMVSEPQKTPGFAASVEKPGTVLASHVKQDWRNAFLGEV